MAVMARRLVASAARVARAERLDRGGVARALAVDVPEPDGDPREGVEPVDADGCGAEPAEGGVGAADVGEFVDEHAAEFVARVARGGVEREHDGGLAEAGDEGCCGLGRFEDADAA